MLTECSPCELFVVTVNLEPKPEVVEPPPPVVPLPSFTRSKWETVDETELEAQGKKEPSKLGSYRHLRVSMEKNCLYACTHMHKHTPCMHAQRETADTIFAAVLVACSMV